VNEPIAIVGLGCRFPGGADSPAAFWTLLLDRVDATREIPPDRWDVDAYYDSNPARPGKMYTRRAAFLDRIDQFDAAFFGIAPREACRVSPQQRLLLETAWEAIEDAGIPAEELVARKTGVFIGISNEDYGETRLRDIAQIDAYTCTGSALSIAANRISYCLNLRGPSFAVDTACSSSLVAVHLACQSIAGQESEIALVGGVNVLLTPERFVGFSKAAMLSPDGRCYAFDERANGYVRAEGAGVVVLKPLKRAEEDGDRIYAVIVGTAINQDGRTAGLSLPSGDAQEQLLRDVYAGAGVAPQAVQYVEMHGTGTPVGDPIEAAAVGKVLGAGRAEGDVCRIGSVKTNIGHLESGSGIAGLIKLALALRHGRIPASLNCERPNPHIPFRELHLRVQQHTEPWPEGRDGRIAGINSFGFGGTNAHAVLKGVTTASVTVPVAAEPPTSGRALVLSISARSAPALDQLVRAFRGLLLADAPPSLQDLCRSAALRRSHHEFRAGLVARINEEMVRQLDAFLAGERRLGVASGQALVREKPKLAFLFAGNGPQWWAMGRQLLESEPVFRDAVYACDRALQAHAGWSLVEELLRDEKKSRLELTEIAQPALFAIQLGLVELWRSWGIEPDAAVGHSVGEIAAAHVAGILSFADAIQVVFHRSRTQGRTAGNGRMAAVELSEDALRTALAGFGSRLSVAAVNAPTAVTVSGEGAALEELLRSLEEQGAYFRRLRLNYAFHSSQMDAIQAELLEALAGVKPRPAGRRMVSAVTGDDLAGPECPATYWWDNIRKPVQFAAAVERLLDDGYGLFLEIGPHPVLASYVSECAAKRGKTAQVLPSLRRKEDESATMLGTLAALYAAGYPIDWRKLHPGSGRFVDLPLYPWQRERHWQEASRDLCPTGKQVHPLLGQRLECAQVQWQVQLDTRNLEYLLDHRVQDRVLLPGTVHLEMAVAAGRELFGDIPVAVEDHEIPEPLLLDGKQPPLVQFALESDGAFGIYARTGGQAGWRLQGKGKLAQVHGSRDLPRIAPATIRQRCPTELPREEIYRQSRLRHYQYGPAFQGLEQVWLGADEALGLVRLPALLADEAGQYFFHPAMLDALWQTFITLLPRTGETARRTTWLPVKTGSYRFLNTPGNSAYAHVRRVQGGSDWIVFDAAILSPEGDWLADFRRVHMQAVAAVTGTAPNTCLYETRWEPQPLPRNEGDLAGDWIVFTDSRQLGSTVSDRLEDGGGRVIRVAAATRFARAGADRFTVVPGCADDMARLFSIIAKECPEPAGIVHCWSVDAAPIVEDGAALANDQELGSLGVLHLLQALLACNLAKLPRLWLVTQGVHSQAPLPGGASVAQAPLWGLGRVIMNEHPGLGCTLVDLSRPDDSAAFTPAETAALLRELAANSPEEEVLLGGDERHVSRLVAAPLQEPEITRERQDLTSTESFRLTVARPGLLDNLKLEIVPRRTPGAAEIEVEPYATGLNFKDVLQAVGILSGAALAGGYMGGLSLGLEFAGRVTRVGKEVSDFAVGDEVVGFGRDSFSGHVVTRADFVAHKPARLGFAEAATIPVAFFTAFHALYELARVQPGERVLIHGAAGGVGLAAVQIVQQAGAEVFATAGSPAKRSYLRSLGVVHVMDSRSLDFADEVLEKTSGVGVDIVLNSLAGSALIQSVRVLKPLGRFLEIGKRDILQNHKLDLAPFERCLSFHSIDIDQLLLHRPAHCSKLFRRLVALFSDGVFQPLPNRVFALDEVTEAFRFMQEARHIGKVVVAPRDGTVRLTSAAKPAVQVRGDASYLITGGLGGFGLATAKWLMDRGARHLVLAGRSGAATPEAQQGVDMLRRAGAEVVVAALDVTCKKHLQALLARMGRDLPPLRGVIHSVLVMDDGILAHLNHERFLRVLAPKAAGAWNLHCLTEHLPLDFFVCYSSLTSVLGIAGQGSYAAANAFLDALASFRRARGLPALTIN
jgi:acyl transferase domain-containing protein